MTRVSGAPSPYGPIFTLNLPRSTIAGKNGSPAGFWTEATATSLDHGGIVTPPFDTSLHSIVGTVYGAVGSGSVTVGIINININGNQSPATFSAATLSPQITRFTRGASTIGANIFGAYTVLTSSSWSQTQGGIYINFYAYF